MPMDDSDLDPVTIGQVMDEIVDEPTERVATCERHGKFVSRRYQLYPGGRDHWSRCAACQEDARVAQEAEDAARTAKHIAEEHERRLNRAGIPSRFRNRTLGSFVAETDAQKRALAIAQAFADEFADRYRRGATLIFSGSLGTGKSHLALGIAQAIMPAWNSIYVTARELVMRLRATWRDDSPISEIELQRTFAGTHLLIIDEIGVQFGTEAERTQLFGIIDERYREELPTIFLTNLDIDGFKAFVGQRAYDRLRECGQWVAFDWDSYRARKA